MHTGLPSSIDETQEFFRIMLQRWQSKNNDVIN
jgi:hypothetical protein